MSRFKTLVSPGAHSLPQSLGLLALRLGAGGFMLTHGWAKIARFSALSAKFPDPLGIGSTASLTLAVSAEFGCAILLILGALTRFAAFPLAVTMVVAAFMVHGGDPFAKKELALLYLVAFVALMFTGAGRLSLDEFLSRSR